MTAIERCIKEAVENGGYRPNVDLLWPLAENKVLLDPLFWQALGKAREWCEHVTTSHQDGECMKCGAPGDSPTWLFVWHRFIDHLASGKTAEEFFAELV